MPERPNFRRLHFSLKDRLVSFISDKLFQNFSYTVRHGLIEGMKRKGGLGFLSAALAPSPQNSAEEAFLRSLDLKGKVVYDVGAFQGVMTLFFARRAKAVVTYEPLPASYARILENVRHNGLSNVMVLNRALGERESVMTLIYDPRLIGAATGDATIGAQIRESIGEAVTLEVPVVRLDDDIPRNNLPLPDFVKIDIEGMELSALEGMRGTLVSRHPELYLEMHGTTAEEKERRSRQIVQFLSAVGHGSLRHVETGKPVAASDFALVSSGHLYCRAHEG